MDGLRLGLVNVNALSLAARIVGRGDGLLVIFFAESHGAGRCSQCDGNLFRVPVLRRPVGLLDRFSGSVNQHGRSPVEAGDLSLAELVATGELCGEVEFTGTMNSLAAGVEAGDIAESETTLAKAISIFSPACAHRADDAGTGDHNALCFGNLVGFLGKGQRREKGNCGSVLDERGKLAKKVRHFHR